MTTRSLRALMGLFALLVLPSFLFAQRPPEPVGRQLKLAVEAFAKVGAEYMPLFDVNAKRPLHIFTMPPLKNTDADLKKVPNPPFAFLLGLDSTTVTDKGLKELKDQKNLTGLYLSHTKVTDAGLKELKIHNNLQVLTLEDTEVTDTGVGDLKVLKNLSLLSLRDTKVTDAGVKELQKALPKCHITR